MSADNKIRAVMSVGRVVVSLGVGTLIANQWMTLRHDEYCLPVIGLCRETIPIGVAIVCAALVYFLLSKFNKGSGDG